MLPLLVMAFPYAPKIDKIRRKKKRKKKNGEQGGGKEVEGKEHTSEGSISIDHDDVARTIVAEVGGAPSSVGHREDVAVNQADLCKPIL